MKLNLKDLARSFIETNGEGPRTPKYILKPANNGGYQIFEDGSEGKLTYTVRPTFKDCLEVMGADDGDTVLFTVKPSANRTYEIYEGATEGTMIYLVKAEFSGGYGIYSSGSDSPAFIVKESFNGQMVIYE